MRKIIGICLCLIAPAWLVLSELQDRLLSAGILNRKDMPPFVGDEKGTTSEWLLNVWHWDAMLGLLMFSILPCLFAGIRLLRPRRILPGFPIRPYHP